MKKATIAGVVLAVLLVLGWAAPHAFIGDSDTVLTGEKLIAARDALTATTRGCSDRIGWPIVVPAVRVVGIELLPGYTEPGGRVRNYSAEVREFTLFGISLGITKVRTESEADKGELSCAF